MAFYTVLNIECQVLEGRNLIEIEIIPNNVSTYPMQRQTLITQR